MDDKKPSKPKKQKNKKQLPSVTPTPLSTNEELLPIPKSEQINIENLFAQALQKYKEEIIKAKKRGEKEFGHLNSIIEEYLSCFVLVGFTLQGEKICIFNANNQRDEGALVDHLRSTFNEIANNRD